MVSNIYAHPKCTTNANNKQQEIQLVLFSPRLIRALKKTWKAQLPRT